MGIHNEEYLSFMTNHVNWTQAQAIATPNQNMNLISVPLNMLLLKIATYMVDLQDKKLYLSPGIDYRALPTWFTKYSRNSMENLKNLARFLT